MTEKDNNQNDNKSQEEKNSVDNSSPEKDFPTPQPPFSPSDNLAEKTPAAQGETPEATKTEDAPMETMAESELLPQEEKKKKKIPPVFLIIGCVFLALMAFLFWANSSGVRLGTDSGSTAIVGGLEATIPEGTDFGQTGEFLLLDPTNLSLKQLQENLTFYPEAEFTAEKSGRHFVITLKKPRNIAYEGTVNILDSKGKTKQLRFVVNGPGLTVTMESRRIRKDDSIVLRFSEQVNARSFAENFSLVPETPFRVEYNLDYINIYPETNWELTSSYQLKINSEYTSKLGKQLATNQILTFSIVKPDGSSYYPEVVHHSTENFIVTEDVDFAIAFSGQSLKAEVPVTIETYRLGDIDSYKYQSQLYSNPETKLDSLEKLSAKTFAVQEGDNSFKIDNPGIGSYIVRSIFEDPADSSKAVEVRTGYLVTPYSVYMQSSKNETLAWIHSGSLPAQNHTVMLAGDDSRTGVTDENGLTVVPHPEFVDMTESEEEYYSYRYDRATDLSEVSILDDSGKLVYFDSAKLRKSNGEPREIFYSYLFLDRAIYRPTDTISFWGFARTFRTNQKPLPPTVRVTLDQAGLNQFVDVPIDSNGIFSGEFKLDSIKSSYYDINSMLIYPDNESGEGETELTLDYAYITVKDFQKPAYVLETSVDKELYQIGETVTVNTSAAFYDGTPLPEFPLEVFYRNSEYDSWEQLPDITTDDQGQAQFTFPVNPNSGYYEALGSNNYRVQIASDGEKITNVGSYSFLAKTEILEQKIEKQSDGKNLQLTINAYEIDIDTPVFQEAYKTALESDNYGDRYNLFSDENLIRIAKGKPTDLSLNLELRWDYTDTQSIKHANRQYNPDGYFKFNDSYGLDFEYVPAYDKEIINDWETKEKKVEVTTTNGTATIKNLIYLPQGSEIDFSKEVICRSYAEYFSEISGQHVSYLYFPQRSSDYDWSYYSEEETNDSLMGLSFGITDKTSGKDLTPASSYYRQISVDLDSTTNFKLLKDGEPVDLNGTILYTIIQGGLYEHKLVNANEFDITQTMEFAPNSQLVAAYFDGYRTHYIKEVDMVVNTKSLELDIAVTADKDSYRPGDTVNLTVKAKDSKGNGVPGNLCLSIVDEAIFAVEEQYLSVANDLFGDLWYLDNYVSRYCTTYRSGGANSGLWSGGKGDGDGSEFYDSFRSNFKDTAKFIPLRTDNNGNATAQFVLPDNTTSWRITAVEVGDKLLAGSSTTNIISTLPFFVKPVTSSKYIDGDEVSLLVQGHGILLDDQSEMDYTVTLAGNGFDKTLTGKGKAFSSIEFNFGKLEVGSYTLTTKAQFGQYSDTVEIPLHVIKSNLELVVNTPIEISLNQPLDINAVRYPVTLSLYNKEAEPYFNSINSLFGHYCMMASQRLSRFTAKKVLSQTMLEDSIPYYIAKGNDSIADMQQGDGGIGDRANSSSNLTLTMYLTLIDKDQFNQKTLEEYLRSFISKSSPKESEKAKAYLALAKLNKIELSEILSMLDVDEKGSPLGKKDLELNVKAYYTAAIAYLGEDELAQKLYTAQLKPQLASLMKTKKQNYWNYSEKEIAAERDIAAIWIAASLLDNEDADKISLYTSDSPWRYRTLFESMIYVINYDREIPTSNYSYTLNGESINAVVGIPGMKSIVLSKTDLESIRFTEMDKNLKASAYFVGEPSELSIEPSENIKVSKTVTKVKANTYKVTISLELSENAPKGIYNISDWIPSNSRLYESYRMPENFNNYYSSMSTENQKVYIDYYHGLAQNRTETISYTIRQTYSAQAMLDTVYVIHGETGENCSSEKAVFVPDDATIRIPVVHLDPSRNIEVLPLPEDQSAADALAITEEKATTQ